MSGAKVLADKVAIVTGGSRGIGRAIAKTLALSGAHVVVNYASSVEMAESLVGEISEAGASASVLQFDVSDSGSVTDAVQSVVKDKGAVHILVNNAGITSDGLFVRTKDEDWQRTIDVNLTGCFYAARAVTKSMMKARWGRIINMSSVIGESGNAGQAAYSASKAGVIGLTKALAKELASRSITVNAITPGYIRTDMTRALSEEQTAGIQQNIPLQRLGEAEDVASAALFLASPESGYITGQVLGVNGGMHM